MKIHVKIFIVLMLYIAIVSTIQRFINPELSETELFLLIKDNVFLIFKTK